MVTREGRRSENECVRFDDVLDAARVSLPPKSNELGQANAPMLEWRLDQWSAGDRLVVQYDFMISQAMHDYVSEKGNNGRATRRFKFTNLCRDRAITYELRTDFGHDAGTLLDFRCYAKKLEGRQERDQFASDVNNPKRTFEGSGGGYDRHPGPDSSYPYGKVKPHPECFQAISDRWVRVTYELTRVEEGTRVKIWLADEKVAPKLVVASPIDPSLGFLNSITDPITALYIELDTSQGTTYDEDQPERWAAFRNVVVLKDVSGGDVLGGQPLR